MIRTLVVDDDFRVADIHREYLERLEGFEVVGVAQTGRQVIEAARRLNPDLCLLDIYLPDISGIDVGRALASGQQPVDIIVITAARDVEFVRDSVARGALHYLVKPFSFETFRQKLESYAAWRGELHRLDATDQQAVDRLYSMLRPVDTGSLPKGLSAVTLELVGSVVRDAVGDLSAAEVAGTAGVSRVTARRYLEHLARTGVATVTLRYGTAGRPEHRYAMRRQPPN